MVLSYAVYVGLMLGGSLAIYISGQKFSDMWQRLSLPDPPFLSFYRSPAYTAIWGILVVLMMLADPKRLVKKYAEYPKLMLSIAAIIALFCSATIILLFMPFIGLIESLGSPK